MRRIRTIHRSAALAAAFAVAGVGAAAAQQGGQVSPGANLVLTGYGTAQYSALLDPSDAGTATSTNDFTASLAPVLLFQMGEDLLFEAELEFGLEGGSTTSTLEYAQIDYLGFENVVVVAGKFLLPFGLFSERLHPSWVNKMPNMPLLYGHAHGGVAEAALLPILSDAGVMARYKQAMGGLWDLDLSLFVTQGPRAVTADVGHADQGAHAVVRSASFDPDHSGGDGSPAAGIVPTVAFGTSFADNNDNKLLGARLGLLKAPRLEVYASGFHSMYDADNYLDLTGGNLAVDIRLGGMELRGEGALLRQEVVNGSEYSTTNRGGYYVQLSRTFGNIEPVVRWGHLLEADLDGALIQENRQRLALGGAYWVAATSPVKVMYEWDSVGDDAIAIQWAFGF